MYVRALAVCLVGLLAVSSGGADDKAEKDKLKGTWKLAEVKWAEEGSTKTIILSSKSYLVIDGDRMTRRSEEDGKLTETKYKLTIHPGKNPAVFERTALEGKDKDKTTTGIYTVDGDTLLMCSKKDGLPTDFTVTQGQDVKDKYLYTYKREKK